MDQLKLRTEELQLQRSLNQIRVEVKNAVIGLQQARVRYQTAVDTRVLAEQSLDAEQKRFQYGATGSDVTTVIQAQQDLANDQSLEVQAMAAYTHAKIAFDQSIGATLDVNRIKWEEALSGRVERESVIPETLPGPRNSETAMKLQKLSQALVWTCCCNLLGPASRAQMPQVFKPGGPAPYRSYVGVKVSPVTLHNSDRIQNLLRAGNLYLTVQDAIALAIEYNFDLEVQRFALPTADWAVERAQAGGPIRGLSAGAPNVGAVDAGVGVLGAIQSAGVSSGGEGGAGFRGRGRRSQHPTDRTSGGETGSGRHRLDYLLAPHVSAIEPVGQPDGLASGCEPHLHANHLARPGDGGHVRYTNYSYSQKENAPGDTLNPAFGPYMRARPQQPLLQNNGVKLNTRSIRIAQNGVVMAREGFRSNLLNLVSSVLTQYWALVTANEELKARQRALEIAQKFQDDTQREIDAGALPRVQLPRAQAELASRRRTWCWRDRLWASLETTMKQQLVRTLDPAIDAAPIIRWMRFRCLSPRRSARAARSLRIGHEEPAGCRGRAIAGRKCRHQCPGNAERDFAGVDRVWRRPGPRLLGQGASYPGGGPDPYFVGGYGTALGQILRRDFPTQYGGIYLGGFPIHNHTAQADYGIEQLQLQSSQLTGQKVNNDIAVSISNEMVALQQARVRYTAAINTRKLQQELLAAEQEKFAYGTATFSTLIIDQRALVTAQISEINALNAYARAHDGLEQVLGQTLDQYNITLEEGLSGHVNRESRIPDVVEPQQKAPATKNR